MNRVVDYITCPKAFSSNSQLEVHMKAIFWALKTTTPTTTRTYSSICAQSKIRGMGCLSDAVG